MAHIALGNQIEIKNEDGRYDQPYIIIVHSAQTKRLIVQMHASSKMGKQQHHYPMRWRRDGDQVQITNGSSTKPVVSLDDWRTFVDQVDVRVSSVSENTVKLSPQMVKMARDVVAYRREAPTDAQWEAEQTAQTAPWDEETVAAAERYADEHRALGLPSYQEYTDQQAQAAVLRERTLWLSRMPHHVTAVTQAVTAREAEHIRQVLAIPEAPPITLSADEQSALAEWLMLWGNAPEPSRRDELLMMRETHAHMVLAELRKKRACGYWNHPMPPILPSPSPAPLVLPQDLQDSRDVDAVLAATARKLRANAPANFSAAAKAAINEIANTPSLAEALAEIPVTKTNEEVMESKVLAESKQAEALLDELLEDVRHGLVHFEERKNKHNVVTLIDGCWLRKGSHDIYLERDGLAQGVIVCTQAPTGTWIPTVRRDEIRAWLKLKPGPSAKDVPQEPGRAAALDLPATGAALDEIGEFARNAPRESAA